MNIQNIDFNSAVITQLGAKNAVISSESGLVLKTFCIVNSVVSLPCHRSDCSTPDQFNWEWCLTRDSSILRYRSTSDTSQVSEKNIWKWDISMGNSKKQNTILIKMYWFSKLYIIFEKFTSISKHSHRSTNTNNTFNYDHIE
jgi:hypothetical protein